MRKFSVVIVISLLCALSAIPTYAYKGEQQYETEWEYQEQGNLLPGNPWYKNGGWHIHSPYLWDQIEQNEIPTWV